MMHKDTIAALHICDTVLAIEFDRSHGQALPVRALRMRLNSRRSHVSYFHSLESRSCRTPTIGDADREHGRESSSQWITTQLPSNRKTGNRSWPPKHHHNNCRRPRTSMCGNRAWDRFAITVRAPNVNTLWRTKRINWDGRENLIEVLDGDLGRSGASTVDRTDFKTIVADVSLAKWRRFCFGSISTGTFECGLASAHRNLRHHGNFDRRWRRVLWSEWFQRWAPFRAEGNHGRRRASFHSRSSPRRKLNKAQKGELRFPLPVGYVFDEAGTHCQRPRWTSTGSRRTGLHGVSSERIGLWCCSPLRGKKHAVSQTELWRRLGTANYIGDGWPTAAVLEILKNPSYAGVYAFGRFRCVKEILEDGEVRSRIARMPRDQWLVEIRDHHEGYLSFDQQLKNLDILEKNRTNPQESVLSGPAREGLALLQGLLICGCCGRRLDATLPSNGGIYPTYQCNWRKREGLSKTYCMSVQCDYLDRAVETRLLEVVNQEQIDLAMEAFEILQQREQQIGGQCNYVSSVLNTKLSWHKSNTIKSIRKPVGCVHAGTTLERCADRTRKRQTTNRRIAWRTEHLVVVWAWPSACLSAWPAKTLACYRYVIQRQERILHLLIDDITIEKPERYVALLHLRWQGGICEDLRVELPRSAAERWKHSESLVNRVRKLAEQYSDAEMAAKLNADGLTSAKGNRFTRSSVSWIRHKHKIPPAEKKKPDELSVKEVAKRFGVSHNVVYYWIKRKIITARRLNQGYRCYERNHLNFFVM